MRHSRKRCFDCGGWSTLTSLYDNWVLERWETAVSDAQSLVLVSLIDTQGTLSLVLEDQRDPQRHRFQVDFIRVPGYRNLLEEYRLELWAIPRGTIATGWTVQVVASPWIAELYEHEPLLEVGFPALRHFLISTEDDVIEVLSDVVPTFYELGPTSSDTPPAGKSTVWYSPEDREEIEATISDVLQRQPSPID